MGVSEKFGRGETGDGQPSGLDGRPGDEIPTAAERRRVAIELVRDHDAQLRASARRVSICADDAEDAVQRGIEILLAKAPTSDARRLLPWARTVVRNEALAIRRTRERTLAWPGSGRQREGEDERDWVAELPSDSAGPSELVARREDVERGREALALLKPQELKALTQLAHGYSYAEIGRMNGWTRTKVNRCLAEGRARLRSVVKESEEGERCGLIAPMISSCADGELEEGQEAMVRNHLAVCGSCRATLREYRALPPRVAALVPAAPAAFEATSEGWSERAAAWVEGVFSSVWTRAVGLLPGQDAGLGATLASGGMRGAGVAGLAKLTALCVGTAGGAAACVAAGILPVPVGAPEKPPLSKPEDRQIERTAAIPAELSIPEQDPEGSRSIPSRPAPAPERSDPPAESDPPEPVTAEFGPEGAAASAPATAPDLQPAPVTRSGSSTASTAVSGEFQP